jgi:threonine dehydrogenase-like Zn-dependent dehydrogenase
MLKWSQREDQMKALVFTGPGVVEVQEVAEPQAGPHETVVEVVRAGICGSDLHGIREPGFRQPPLIMGHEFAGRTSDGRRVVVNPLVACGSCDQCVAARPELCRHRSLVGIHRPGGFAERVAVPESAVHELPKAMSWEEAALVEPMANAVHAWRLAGGAAGRRVGVIGCGTIGLVCLEAARSGGAARLAGADISPERQDAAKRLGAEVGAALDGEFDVVVDAVGLPSTRAQAMEHLIGGGTAVWLGLASADAGIDAQALVRTEKRIVGSFAYSEADFLEAINRVGRLDLSWVETFPLSLKAVAIFNQLMNGEALPIKALLQP